MKIFRTEVKGVSEANSVELITDGSAKVNGKEYKYEFRFVGNNLLLLRINNRNYFMMTEKSDDDEDFKMTLDSKIYDVVCKSELDILTEKLSGNKSKETLKKEIRSPMPGIIKALNVKPGQQVAKGDVLLVLEAMKMENEIKAQNSCVIKSVSIEAMSSVEKNELLITLE